MNKIYLRAFQGGVLAVGAPLGWLVINLYLGESFLQEITNHIGLYSYMLFGTMLVFILFGVYAGKNEEFMASYAFNDALTNTYNVRYFRERFENEVSASHRHKGELSLIYFDLDYFKKVNDKFGHPAGDKVLKSVADRVKKVIRANDTFARVGGEEFAILQPHCSLADAKLNAERLRVAIEKLEVNVKNEQIIRVTTSLGVATLTDSEEAEQLYKRADSNLYLAKQQGRNRVVG